MTTVNPIDFLFLCRIPTTASATSSTLPLPPPLLSLQRLDKIVETMIGDNFHDWAADFLSSVDDPLGIPLSATLFIPSGYDPVTGTVTTATNGTMMSPLAMACHIVPQRLIFSELLRFKPLSWLPALLPKKSILISNYSGSNYTLDGVLVSEPDLFLSSTIAVHELSSPLNLSPYGGADDSLVRRDPTKPLDETEGSSKAGSDTAASCVPRVLAVVCGVSAFKILF